MSCLKCGKDNCNCGGIKMTTPPTPSQNPKTLDEVCDKPTGTFKEFVKAQDSLTALQNDIQRVTRKLALGERVFMGDLENILSAAKQLETFKCPDCGSPVRDSLSKTTGRPVNVGASPTPASTLQEQLSALQTENSEMSIELGENAKSIMALQTENDIVVAGYSLDNLKDLLQDRDSLKSTLEATLKTFDERGAGLVTLQGMLESTRKENVKMREALKHIIGADKMFDSCPQCKPAKELVSTPPTNADNSKDVK